VLFNPVIFAMSYEENRCHAPNDSTIRLAMKRL
jgi:hypothetical protein